MATVQAFDQIKAFVDAGWADATLHCSIAWDNEAFTEPQPYDENDQPNHWVKVLVDGKLLSQESIGSGDPKDERWEESGDMQVFVMVPVRTGSLRARAVLTEFARMCQGQEAGTVEFGDILFNPIGAADDEGKWWTMSIVIEWKRG